MAQQRLDRAPNKFSMRNVFFGHWKEHADTTASIQSTVYGDGQEGTENLMQKY